MVLLRWVPIIVCITGIGTILLTRSISFLTTPELFEHSVPTISRTAATEPANMVFIVGMTIVAAMSQIGWPTIFLSYKCYFPLLTSKRKLIISMLTCAMVTGMIAGLCLGTMAHISLEDSSRIHIIFSYGFFICQLVAYLVDTLAVNMIKKQLNVTGTHPLNIDFKYRSWVAFSLPVMGIIFYFLYNAKVSHWYENQILVEAIYVSAEHIVAIGCFLYSATIQRYIYTQYSARQ